jgi:hypothetical protein
VRVLERGQEPFSLEAIDFEAKRWIASGRGRVRLMGFRPGQIERARQQLLGIGEQDGALDDVC